MDKSHLFLQAIGEMLILNLYVYLSDSINLFHKLIAIFPCGAISQLQISISLSLLDLTSFFESKISFKHGSEPLG